MGDVALGAKCTRELGAIDCSAHRPRLWETLVCSRKTKAICGGKSEGKQEALPHCNGSGVRKGRLER